jgi:hypothetical protein
MIARAMLIWVSVLSAMACAAAQSVMPVDPRPNAQAEANQTAAILGLTPTIRELSEMQAKRGCGVAPRMEELLVRQKLLETELTTTLDVDGVLAEISAERSDLTDLRAALQGRRDRTVGYLNVASLITGSGVGIAVNAMQLKDSTAIAGDYVGIGSGIASTALSLIAIKKMNGPKQSVGNVPNMLAPLFDQQTVLNTYYPPEVMRFLESVPPAEDPGRGTRLDQMKAAWVAQGRIGTTGSGKDRAKLAALTSSESKQLKVSIDDLTDRIAMLNDVSGRVSLMKRDLATLMHGYKAAVEACGH